MSNKNGKNEKEIGGTTLLLRELQQEKQKLNNATNVRYE